MANFFKDYAKAQKEYFALTKGLAKSHPIGFGLTMVGSVIVGVAPFIPDLIESIKLSRQSKETEELIKSVDFVEVETEE